MRCIGGGGTVRAASPLVLVVTQVVLKDSLSIAARLICHSGDGLSVALQEQPGRRGCGRGRGAGGCKPREPLRRCYQQPDPDTMLAVVLGGAELREKRASGAFLHTNPAHPTFSAPCEHS